MTKHHFNSVQGAIETAFAYHRAGDFSTAESCYEQIMAQIDKPDGSLFFGYGTLLISQQKFGLGIALLQAALQTIPESAPIWTNLACAYKHIGRDELALNAYNKALSFAGASEQPDVLAGIAGFWINKANPQAVVDYARRALQIDPDHIPAHMHLGMGLLEQGKFEEAWPHYEARWDTPERIKDKRPYKAPRWDGTYVQKLAIHGEQGLGDEILFMSLAKRAQERVGEIVIECAERLIPYFTEAFGARCYADHAALIAAEGEPNAYISMASLPLYLGLPDGRPFLKRNRRVPKGRPLVGIAWKGGTLRTNVKDRSIILKDFAPIFAAPNVDFVSVQYGQGLEGELEAFGLDNLPNDFASLHQRIADCDLIVSVCQTAVHQAGAMGVDCWCLVPERAAWRYMGQNMLPWYNSVQFFRQKAGDWSQPIADIASLLKERYADLAA